jgi:site-specific recombinase XerD
MLVWGMAEQTRETYLAAVARLARHYRRAPDQLSPQEVQAYLVHMLQEEKLAWSTCSIVVQAFRFFYHATPGRPEPIFTIPGPKEPKKLPEILSPAEARRLVESTSNRKQRALPK